MRVYEFRFTGINKKTKEEKCFKAFGETRRLAYDKLVKSNKYWEFKY